MSLHKLLREGDGFPQTICGREGDVVIVEGRRYMKTLAKHMYELARPMQKATCRHCLHYLKLRAAK